MMKFDSLKLDRFKPIYVKNRVKLIFTKKELQEKVIEYFLIGIFVGAVIGHFVTVLMIIYADPVGDVYGVK